LPAEGSYGFPKLDISVGYIGSPKYLTNADTKAAIVALLQALQQSQECRVQFYVGTPNIDLQRQDGLESASIQEQDMMTAPLNMFDAIIVTPGGHGAEIEAKRFLDHTKFYALTHSGNAQLPSKWFADLPIERTYDLHKLDIHVAASGILSEQAAATGTNRHTCNSIRTQLSYGQEETLSCKWGTQFRGGHRAHLIYF
jgi:hypothetical protein